MRLKYLSSSPSQTKKLGETLARKIGKDASKKKHAQIICLEGGLGGGKTTFLQGFAKGLGVQEKILSPTFILIKKYKIQDTKYKTLYHIDCYRIEKPKGLLDLGFKKIISDPQNIIVIEWADKIRRIIPKDATWIKFGFVNVKRRKITIMVK